MIQECYTVWLGYDAKRMMLGSANNTMQSVELRAMGKGHITCYITRVLGKSTSLVTIGE